MCVASSHAYLCFAVWRCLASYNIAQATQKFTIYPKHANHEALAARQVTPSAVLIDALSTSNRTQEVFLVQTLCKLEECQIALADCKRLSKEEDRLMEVDEASLLKTDLEAAKLAPALVCLRHRIEGFATFIAGLPGADLEKEPLVAFNFPEVVSTLTKLHETEQNVAIDRWKDVLRASCTEIQKAFPKDWKKKCVESYDQEFVRSKILVQSIIDQLGQDYSVCSTWLKSLDKITPICDAFKLRYKEDLESVRSTVDDAVSLTATILAYNLLVFRFPKMESAQRRQGIQDLKKKVAKKLGKTAVVPDDVIDRLTEAISGK